MSKKTSQTKKSKKVTPTSPDETMDLDIFAEKLTQNMVKNLDYNLQHPEEFQEHEAEVDRELQKVLTGKGRKKK